MRRSSKKLDAIKKPCYLHMSVGLEGKAYNDPKQNRRLARPPACLWRRHVLRCGPYTRTCVFAENRCRRRTRSCPGRSWKTLCVVGPTALALEARPSGAHSARGWWNAASGLVSFDYEALKGSAGGKCSAKSQTPQVEPRNFILAADSPAPRSRCSSVLRHVYAATLQQCRRG